MYIEIPKITLITSDFLLSFLLISRSIEQKSFISKQNFPLDLFLFKVGFIDRKSMPGVILSIQIAGDLMVWHPHCHCL